MNIKSIVVRQGRAWDRSGEPKKTHNKIYVWPDGESIVENLQNRRNRPHTTYKKEVIPAMLEKLKKEQPDVYNIIKDHKWSWNQSCGCSMCPCSPGFVGDVKSDRVMDIHVTITD